MKKITLTFFLTALVCSLFAQDHITEVISGELGGDVKMIEYDERVYSPQGDILKVYDGVTWEDFPMPVVGGVALVFQGQILDYHGSIYVSMHDGSNHYISRFTGSGFSTFMLPSALASDVVTFNGKMHMLLRNGTSVKLCSYDGVTFREISSSFLTSSSYKLVVAGLYLYINGSRYHADETNWLKRYDGVSFTTMPMRGRILTSVYQVGFSPNVYLIFDDRVLCHYDGSTLTELVLSMDGAYITSGTLFRGEFYVRFGDDEPHPERLIKFNGTTPTEISAPAGTQFPPVNREMTFYRGALYHPLDSDDGTTSVYRFDGTTWEPIYDWGPYGYGLMISERRGKLVFYRLLNSSHAVEYDGETSEPFDAPEGIMWFVVPKASTSCYHVWLAGYVDESGWGYEYRWVLVKETFDLTGCAPPESVSIIPGILSEYDNYAIGAAANERDWCWTGIDIDWIITPLCITPPCTPPPVKTTLIDKGGKIGWQKTFDKPFSTSIPLNDTQPYALSVAVGKDQSFKDVLLFDKDLVNNGIEQISLDMYPKEDYLFLTVTTDNKKEVPFTMTLRNTKGESLWQQQFMAPMDELISAYVPKAGDYLQFSLLQAPKSVTLYYPNPFTGKLNINTTEASGPVSVSLTNLNGKVITQKDFIEPGEYSLDASSQKPGLYILTIVEGGSVRKELVEMK